MKIIIFGATGTVGKQVVKDALDVNYEVTAFSRDLDKLVEFNSNNLTKLKGDVFDKTQVNQAIKGMDAVVIVLGSGRKGKVRAQATLNIINSMKHNQVKRLICQSTLGTGSSQGNLNFFWKYIMFGWFLKPVFLDHELQEKYVKNSDLDWTIIRPAAFTNGDKTGAYKHGFNSTEKSLKLKISRADVSDFLMKQLQSKKYLFKTPGLSY